MPQRAMSLAWGIAGLIAVIGVVLVGVNASRAASRGPAWRRRLLGAGLVLMAALGASSCSRADMTSAPTQTPATKPSAALEETPEWKAILDAWQFTAPLAESRKSTEAQRKVVEEKIAAVKLAGEKLAAAGLISAAEAQLLAGELANLRATILKDPPTDCQVTCYDMMMISPERESLDRLAARLPLLKRLAADAVVHPGVAAKILPAVESDLRRLSEAQPGPQLPPDEQKRRATLRAEAETCVKEIKALLGKPAAALDETPEWKGIAAAWAEASEVASGKRGDYPFDKTGQKKLLDALAKADADVAKFRAAGLLGEAETVFLKIELAQLVAGVQMKRPTEMRMATCYEPMWMPTPAERGLKNLTERVPLVEKMVESGKVSPAAALKVIEALQRDIAAAETSDANRPLSEADQARAAELVKKARAGILRIRPDFLRQTCYSVILLKEQSMRTPGEFDAQRALLDRLAASGALTAAAAEKAREALADEMRKAAGGEA